MIARTGEDAIVVRAFRWEYWSTLWKLRTHQLKEEGIDIKEADVPVPVDLSSRYEQDYHRMDQVYLSGAGNFWLAWMAEIPVGHVGAQDLGGVVELRRMYVRTGYRRQGVGTRLVRALIDHCVEHAVQSIELWTTADGPSRPFYTSLGFHPTESPGKGYIDIERRDELRMCLELVPDKPLE